MNDFRSYCSIKRRNVGILEDCQLCETNCLETDSESKADKQYYETVQKDLLEVE